MSTSFFDPVDSAAGLWFPEAASSEQRLLYESIRQFSDEIASHETALENHDYPLARSLFRQCADLGVFSAELDESDGGLGLGVVDATLLCEALGRGPGINVGLMVHQGVGMLPIACFGTEKQRAVYLTGAAEGERIMAFALTEPHSGSDALALTTEATPQDDGYRIRGTKQFITNAGYADTIITFARVPGAGITAFLVDAGAPGLSIGPEEHKLGQHASSTCSVSYDDVFVSSEHLLGAPGNGHQIALNMLNLGRLKLAAACVGKMKSLLPQAVQYTKERKAFGEPISVFGMLRDRIARMASLCYAAESVVYRVASVVEKALEDARKGRSVLPPAERLAVLREFALECALAKSFVTESLGTFTDDMLQLYGGYGFSEEYPAARAFRDARVTRLYEGTTEVCRLTAVRRLCALVGQQEFDARATTEEHWLASIAKRMIGRQLGNLARADDFDAAAFHRDQEATGDIAAALEQVYAVESGWLRCKALQEESTFAQNLVAHFEAMIAPTAYAPLPMAPRQSSPSCSTDPEAGWSTSAFGARTPTRERVVEAVLASNGLLPGAF